MLYLFIPTIIHQTLYKIFTIFTTRKVSNTLTFYFAKVKQTGPTYGKIKGIKKYEIKTGSLCSFWHVPSLALEILDIGSGCLVD